MTDAKPYRHRFPMTIIQHAVWLYHHFPLSYRDIQELLYQRDIQVSHETLREWCIKFGPLFAEELRHREPRRGSRWHLDEVCTTVDGVRHWLWRAVDEYGFVQGILLQRHHNAEAAKTFLTRLLGEYDVPEVIHTDQLRSYRAAIREIPSLVNVDHQQVISTARCNNIVEQRASVASRAVLPKTVSSSRTASRAKSAELQSAETRSSIPESPRPNHEPPPPLPKERFRLDQTKSSAKSVPDVVNGRSRGGLNFRPPLPSACHTTI